jgi:hypothetical protein
MSNPLAASQENISRARRKFADLKASINRHLEGHPYSIRIHRDADLSHIIARREKDIDVDMAFDTVEIVQRLRIALDKAVFSLVEFNKRGTSGVGFPFGGIDRNTGKPNPFPDERMTGKHGLEKKLTAGQWRFICAQRPYPGGNGTLWAINEIANVDKHRKHLVTVEPNLSHNLEVRGGIIDTIIFLPTKFQHLLADQERETILASMGNMASESDIKHHFSASVVFGNGFGVDRRNVLSTLNEQIRQTNHIVGGFRAFF